MNYVNRDKIDLQHFLVFQYFFYNFVFLHIYVSKGSSTKYYSKNKENYQKKFVKDIKIFLKKKKKKSNNIVVKNKKIYQKMKRKSLFSTEKNINSEKMTYNYKKLLF